MHVSAVSSLLKDASAQALKENAVLLRYKPERKALAKANDADASTAGGGAAAQKKRKAGS